MRARGLRLVVAVLVLSGCGGAPTPATLPNPTQHPSPTASAAPSPPVMPAAAKTRAGAEASVRYFLSTLEYAGASGDTTKFQDTYSPECARCAGITAGIEKTYADGGSILGGAWRPTRLKFYGIKNDIAFIDALVDYEPQTWKKDSSAKATTSPARRGVLKAFQLIWRGGRWRVGALDPRV